MKQIEKSSLPLTRSDTRNTADNENAFAPPGSEAKGAVTES